LRLGRGVGDRGSGEAQRAAGDQGLQPCAGDILQLGRERLVQPPAGLVRREGDQPRLAAELRGFVVV
jgi:hypothetical protein